MNATFLRAGLVVWLIAAPLVAQAKCGLISGKGEINVISNAFSALNDLAKEMESCSRPGLKVTVKITPEARVETERAFATASASPFAAAVVSMGTFSGLYSRGQLQNMTDLAKKYRSRYNIEESMLVRVDGEVMAIAFMKNTQNLFYRKDIFDKHNLKVPVTYAEMLATAATIKSKESSIDFPIAQTFAKGFDSATEFVNLLASHGGRMFKAGSARPEFNSDAGIQAIETMRALLPFMTPNALASNSDDVMNQFQQGKAAMGVLWASRAERMDDPRASKVVGKMEFAAAPKANASGRVAAHLWWDGVVMPKNSGQDRDVVFQVLMEALDEETTRAANDRAIWVRSIYQPTRFGAGVTATAQAGAPIWPTEPFFGLAHGEIGKVLPEALAGKLTPKTALDTAAAAYEKSAADHGFIR